MTCAEALHAAGAELLTARFHDHGAVLGLPEAGPARPGPPWAIQLARTEAWRPERAGRMVTP